MSGELPPNPLDLAYWYIEFNPPRWDEAMFLKDVRAFLERNDPWKPEVRDESCHDGGRSMNRIYVVAGRYGYQAVDEYSNGDFVRVLASGLTKKMADIVATAAGTAYADGLRDALVGLQVPLLADVGELSAGEVVSVISRKGAWFVIRDIMGREAECQYCHLRNES